MLNTIPSCCFGAWNVLLLAIALGGASFAIQRRQGINLADEGFLWYGAQQTARGKVPLRDFQAYDPGRYYWSAIGILFLGQGLVALRFSETVFQAVGLWAGLLTASRIAQDWTLLAAVGLMLTLWMVPSFKHFDGTLLLCGIWVAVRLIEQPSAGRIFEAGFFVGLCVFFGRNHALYNFLAQASLLLLVYFKLRPPLFMLDLGMWLAGTVVGLMPMIVLFVCIAGFPASYIESIRSILRHGTNLALPVPWPWRVSPNSAGGSKQFVLGIFLVILPLAYVAGVTVSLFMRSQMIKDDALFIACAFVGLSYLHYAFSRADFTHLAQAIHPFALGALALVDVVGAPKLCYWAVTIVLSAAALFTVGRQMPVYQRLTSMTPWVPCHVGDKIFVHPFISGLITCLRTFASENIAPEEGVLILPFTPALYSILGHESPLWNLVCYFPATTHQQRAMIHEVTARNVNWAVIWDTALDNREDRRFSVTHDLVWDYLMQNFEPAKTTCLPRSWQILRRKNPAE